MSAGRHTAAEPAMRSFDESLPMALLRAREAAMRLFRPLLAEHDLTEQQWRVLRALTDLAERTFLLSPSVSRIIADLDERGLVARRADPADRRRSLLSLTDAGHDLVASVAPESEARYAAIESSFGSARLRRLLDELHDLARLDLPEANA